MVLATEQDQARAAVISVHDGFRVGGSGDLAGFREEFFSCLTRRADVLFELADAVLCADGPVHSLVGLSLIAEHRRGHGALYDALNNGRVEMGRLRQALAGLPLPRDDQGRLVLAVDVSAWLRPDAVSSPDRSFCHVNSVTAGAASVVPGWPYSFVVALEPGRTSWTAVLDVQRLAPHDNLTEVTAAQVRHLIAGLRTAGQWQGGDPPILIVFDAGYDIVRLAWLLKDLPVQVLARLRSNRVFHLPGPPRTPGQVGRTTRHGPRIDLDQPDSHPTATVSTVSTHSRHGTVNAHAWDRTHQQLQRRAGWATHPGHLPLVEGTLIRVSVQRSPGHQARTPMWLWTTAATTTPEHLNRTWQAYLRRFDIEHMFRLFKQTLGWVTPRLRDSHAADRWTWLIITVHTQLRLARDQTTDLRHPWERTAKPGRPTPTRTRRAFRHLRATLPQPANAPKPTRPGPGRPPGSKNQKPTTHHPISKPRHQKTPKPPKTTTG